ncbi:MAG: carboxylating nicotinate-nucleotide diphosphorylase [Acidimicrobiia bacterium]|nr:carboxylating nicotinate-nucleotide diphosphorylase [Acidimicrobiia bacterium]
MKLDPLIYEPILRRALDEDLGEAGDLTTSAIIPADVTSSARLVSRQPGTIAGLEVAGRVFSLVDPRIEFRPELADGDTVEAGSVLATVAGPAAGILTAERTALNFLGHLSGIATATAAIVASVRPHRARVADTRKTTPGLRALEKYAVRAGGGVNHRFGLDDAVLVKDNHVAVAGSVAEAVARVRRSVGHLVKVEVEVDTLDQLHEALSEGVDAVLLDNMSLDDLRAAVALVDGRALTEASGGITPETAPLIAATGVDVLSAGYLTHSASSLDVGLDF